MATNASEFTVQKNTAVVEQATADHSAAQIDEIERRAKAQVADVREQSARVEEAEKKSAGNSGSVEGQVYGDLALEATGLKLASTVIEFIDARLSDKTESASFSPNEKPRTIEEDIHTARRAPGVYRTPVKEKSYDDGNEDKKSKPFSVSSKEGILSRSNIAASSLKDQEKDALKTWDVPEKQSFAGVKMAKEMTVDLRNANEKSLESAIVARQQHSAVMNKINQIAPSMGLGSGPSIRPQDLLREAEQVAASGSVV